MAQHPCDPALAEKFRHVALPPLETRLERLAHEPGAERIVPLDGGE